MTKKASAAAAALAVEEFDIAEVLDLTVPTSFVYKGKVINVEVYAEKLTPDFQDALRAANDKSDSEAVRFLLGASVQSWSLTWRGEAFPPSAENIGRCPGSFLAACTDAVMGIWQADSPAAPAKS